MKKYYSILIGMLLFAAGACEKDDIVLGEEPVNIELSSSNDNVAIDAGGKAAEVNFGSQGGRAVIDVETDQLEWSINNTTDWIVTESNKAGITVIVGENTESGTRSGSLTLTVGGGDNKETATVTVMQRNKGGSAINVDEVDVVLTAGGKYPRTIEILSDNDQWNFEVECTWLKLEKEEFQLKFTAEPNPDFTERTTTVYVYTEADSDTKQEITVLQEAKSYIDPDLWAISFHEGGGNDIISLSTNQDLWTYSVSEGSDWLTVAQKGNSLELSATPNTQSDNRIATIKLSTGTLDNVSVTIVNVAQIGTDPDAMVIGVSQMGSIAKNPTLPLFGTVDCVIDWGDGTVEHVMTQAPSHAYKSDGQYYVTIKGTATYLCAGMFTDIGTDLRQLITEYRRWGKTGLTSMYGAGYYLENLTYLPADTNGSFEDVDNFGLAFYYCNNLTDISEDLFAYSNNAISFSKVFYSCKNLETIPAGLFRNCTAAVYFNGMFTYCPKIKAIPKGIFDNCTKVENVYELFMVSAYGDMPVIPSIPEDIFHSMPNLKDAGFAFSNQMSVTEIPPNILKYAEKLGNAEFMFQRLNITSIPENLFANCKSLVNVCATFAYTPITSIPENLFAVAPSISDFRSVFTNCSELKSIPKELFSRNVDAFDFYNVFSYCNSLTSVPEGLFDKNINADDFRNTFLKCENLTDIPPGLFKNCPKVTTYQRVFGFCTSLETVPADIFNGTRATTTTGMFYSCSSLKSVPEGLFDSFTATASFNDLFYGCSSLTTVPVSIFDKNTNVTNFGGVFNGCTSLQGESPYTMVEGNKVHLYERGNYAGQFAAPKSYSKCFRSATGLSDYADIPDGWK